MMFVYDTCSMVVAGTGLPLYMNIMSPAGVKRHKLLNVLHAIIAHLLIKPWNLLIYFKS